MAESAYQAAIRQYEKACETDTPWKHMALTRAVLSTASALISVATELKRMNDRQEAA